MKPSIYQQQLQKICEVAEVSNARQYRLGDQTFSLAATAPAMHGYVGASYGQLCQQLAYQLYCDFYIAKNNKHTITNGDLSTRLLQKNQTQDSWDPDWKIYRQYSDGRILVQKGDASRMAVVGEYASNKWPGVPPQTGDLVHLRIRPGMPDLQAGYYYSFGQQLSDQFDECQLLRCYFNVHADSADALLHQLSKQLNRYKLPFRFKTLLQTQAYDRSDAAVLYCARRYVYSLKLILQELYPNLRDLLLDTVPMFTLALHPGIALADDPGNGESFGMHRCRIVAEGLLAAWLNNQQSCEQKLRHICGQFLAYQLDPERPYLNKNSVGFIH